MKTPLEVLRLYPVHEYTLNGAFESRMRADPRRDFLLHESKTWSWGEFHAAALRTARMLAARGIRKGDRIGILAKNSDAHVLLLFACTRIGAIMVPGNPEFGAQEAGYVLTHAGVSGVVCSQETLPVVSEACKAIDPAPWHNRVWRRYGSTSQLRRVADACASPRRGEPLHSLHRPRDDCPR